MGSFAPQSGAKLPKPLSFSPSLREGGRGMGESSCPRLDKVVPWGKITQKNLYPELTFGFKRGATVDFFRYE
jgi:hypothetical protein